MVGHEHSGTSSYHNGELLFQVYLDAMRYLCLPKGRYALKSLYLREAR